jgi:hypothetical protein
MYVKGKGRITNKEHQEINQCSTNTSSNDLKNLTQKDYKRE